MANATTRAKRLNETKMILQQPLLLIAIILSFALLLLFVIYPLAKTLIYSLTDETGAFSLANLIAILQTPRYGKVFGRTMALGLIVCYAFGTFWFVEAYSRVKGPISVTAALAMCVLPFILPDAVKISLALLITGRLAPVLRIDKGIKNDERA